MRNDICMAQWHLVELIDMCDICISSFISRSAAERMEKEGKTRLTLCYCLRVSPAVLKTRASDFCDASLFEACA